MTTEAPVALVTGSAKRIGAALIEALHERGYRVLIHYRDSAEAARAAAQRLNRKRPDSAHTLAARLESVAEVRALGQAAANHWGRLDVLINNASSFYATPMEEADESDWEVLMGSNLRGPFFLSQTLLPALRSSLGCIINMVDIHADRPLANHPIYCAAKAGLAMLTRSMARDLAPEIRVNGIAPGAILWPEYEPPTEEEEHQILRRIPAHRLGNPQDIVRTALFLIEDAPYINGQIIAVDGGKSQT